MTKPLPRAAYVHVPFCRHRCGYCNFTLVAGRDDLIESYLGAIERELSWLETPRPVETLYIGGGTPSHLAQDQLRRLFDLLHRWFPLESSYELTVEVNPADVNAELIEIIAEYGTTRVSLGGQSFDREKLAILERDHSGDDIRTAIRKCQETFAAVSLDLIFGTPGETLSKWRTDLRSALKLEPEHISTYGLTIERGTSFWGRLLKGNIKPLDEELEREMYETAIDELTGAGFEHYEVSNFARPGYRSRHNQVYWNGQPYFAVGPGASRYIDGRRETNHRSTTTYLQRVLNGYSPVAESEQLDAESIARERLVFGLRQLKGIDRDAFSSETGFEIEYLVGREVEKLVGLGILEWADTRLKLTRNGLPISDSIWPELL